MEIFLVLLLVKCIFTAPVENFDVEGKRYGNFDEWGPYFQGDMRFAGGWTRNGILGNNYRWPGGIVYYEFSDEVDEVQRNTLLDIMKGFTRKTDKCIKFRERTRPKRQKDHILFTTRNTGCWSYVGRQGKRQKLNLQDPGCLNVVGIVEHELSHALGFYHEQSRTDRDGYVTIIWDNIQAGYRSNFDKLFADETYGVAYDYGSVMHYSKTAFSIDGSFTIVPIPDPNVEIGQRRGLSEGDIIKIKSMYNSSCPAN